MPPRAFRVQRANIMMRRTAAAVQILIVLLIVGYGTYHLFLGNFMQSYATLPFLIGYYLLILAWQRRVREREREKDGERPRGH